MLCKLAASGELLQWYNYTINNPRMLLSCCVKEREEKWRNTFAGSDGN
jgi:hypothetical protein